MVFVKEYVNVDGNFKVLLAHTCLLFLVHVQRKYGAIITEKKTLQKL